MSWIDRCVGTYDWVASGEDYRDPDYPKKKVDHFVALGAEVVGFFTQMGGYVLYDSDFIPRVPDLEYDLFGEFVKECKKRDIKVMVFWVATNPGNAYQLTQHPDWQQLGPGGQPTGALCYVSPFGRYTRTHLREVLSRYHVDAVYFDQFPVGCFCPYCRDLFERRFGLPLPLDANLPTHRGGPGVLAEAELYGAAVTAGSKVRLDLFEAFVEENARSFVWNVRKVIDATNPAVKYFQGKVYGPMARKLSRYLDGLLPEVLWWTVGDDLYSLALHRQMSRAYAGLPTMDPVKYDLGVNRRSRPVAEAKVLLAQAVANRCAPFLRDHHVSELSGQTEELGTTLRQLGMILKARSDARPLAYAALLHSERSEAHADHGMSAAARGVFKTLLQHHIPTQVVTEQMVADTDLSDHRVLILPECDKLLPGTPGALDAFVQQGGGVVAIGRAATHGVAPANDPLAQVLGVEYVALAGEEHQGAAPSLSAIVDIPAHHGQPFQYGRARAGHPISAGVAGVTFSFTGGYIEADYTTGFVTVADVLAFDLAKLQAPYFNRRILWPGDPVAPLLSVREAGRGRVVYLAAPIGALVRRAPSLEIDRLLTQAVRWAAGQNPPVDMLTDAPAVRMDVDWDAAKSRYAVMLTNLTLNDFREGYIRWVAPRTDIELLVRTGDRSLKDARTASGTEVEVRSEAAGLIIRVPRVEFFEAVYLSMA